MSHQPTNRQMPVSAKMRSTAAAPTAPTVGMRRKVGAVSHKSTVHHGALAPTHATMNGQPTDQLTTYQRFMALTSQVQLELVEYQQRLKQIESEIQSHNQVTTPTGAPLSGSAGPLLTASQSRPFQFDLPSVSPSDLSVIEIPSTIQPSPPPRPYQSVVSISREEPEEKEQSSESAELILARQASSSYLHQRLHHEHHPPDEESKEESKENENDKAQSQHESLPHHLQHLRQSNHTMHRPTSVESTPPSRPQLTEFPALQRESARHAAAALASSTSQSTNEEVFPALARAIHLRQQRLQRFAPSSTVIAPAASHSNSILESKSNNSVPSSIPITLAPDCASPPRIHTTSTAATFSHDHAHITLADHLDSDDDQLPAPQSTLFPVSPMPLNPAAQEERDVKLLLKQQALQLIYEQVQARIKQLTRQRFFIVWSDQFRFQRAQRMLAMKQMSRSLRLWRDSARMELQRKNAAAIKIQTSIRGHLARRHLPALRSAVQLHRCHLLHRLWSIWSRRVRRIHRWRQRWQLKLGKVHNHILIVHRAGLPFPAKRIRSSDGTMVLAESYARWRQLCLMWCRWLKYLADGGRTQPTLDVDKPTVRWK